MQDSLSDFGLPIGLERRDGKIGVIGGRIPKINLREPFLIDSLSVRFDIANVDKQITSEQNILVRPLHYQAGDERITFLTLEAFIEKYRTLNIPVSKLHFIFHMSRCGSTLTTQMISEVDRFYVISEPTIINEILDPSFVLPKTISRADLLKAVINAIYSFKPEHCEHVFIKFRSWNTFFIREILSLYPGITWAFIHRNGIEVMESVLRNPPGWLRGRDALRAYFSKILGIADDELCLLTDSGYSARILGAICREAGTISENAVYITYEKIPLKLAEILDAAFSLDMNSDEKNRMLKRARFYSKDTAGDKIFKEDSHTKRDAMDPADYLNAKTFIESEREKLSKEIS